MGEGDAEPFGVIGMGGGSTPSGRSASATAERIAAGPPIVPASPQPFAPSGFIGLGVSMWSSVAAPMKAVSAARGRA